MSVLDQHDVMFGVNDDGTLVVADGYGFNIDQASDKPQAGDLVHYQIGKTHRVWRLTGERDERGGMRGVWPD